MAGVILDSSIIIAAERRGQTVLQILEGVRASQGDKEVGLSVVTIAVATLNRRDFQRVPGLSTVQL